MSTPSTEFPGTGVSDSGISSGSGSGLSGVASDMQTPQVAKEKVADVAAEAKDQALGLAHQVRSQMQDRTAEQHGRAKEQVRSVSDNLRQLAEGGGASGPVQQMVQELASRGEMLADYIESKDPQELMSDLRTFARRRPLMFLAGAAAAGLIAGRLTRGVVDSQRSDDTSEPASIDLTTTSTPAIADYPSSVTTDGDLMADSLSEPYATTGTVGSYGTATGTVPGRSDV